VSSVPKGDGLLIGNRAIIGSVDADGKTAHRENFVPQGVVGSHKGSGGPGGAPTVGAGECGAREVLERVGDKWSLYVVHLLGTGTKRFSELHRTIEGITPRMLTVTVRTLERDGLVSRAVYPVVPPRVEYTLTAMGTTLLEAVTPLVDWAGAHLGEIHAARARYDEAHQQPPDNAPLPDGTRGAGRLRVIPRAPT
jgi:DNA-binding HxlR family transcriptional regulator